MLLFFEQEEMAKNEARYSRIYQKINTASFWKKKLDWNV